MIAEAAARGAQVAANCLSNAIGTSWANGTSKMVDVDLAVMKSPDVSNHAQAIGARDACRSGSNRLLPLRDFDAAAEPVCFINESGSAIDSLERRVAVEHIETDVPLQLVQAHRAEM